MYKKIKNKKAFTLVELVVVVAVLLILSAIAIPLIGGVIRNAHTAADASNAKNIEKAIKYAIAHNEIGDEMSTTIEEALELSGMDAATILNAEQDGYEYYYDNITQTVIPLAASRTSDEVLLDSTGLLNHDGTIEAGSGVTPPTLTPTSYIFGNLDLSGFNHTGTWTENSTGFMSSFGLLFVPVGANEYQISSTAVLAAGTSGGYGILFDTTVNASNQDSGYVLQLDRGLVKIVIRRRTNGSESAVLPITYLPAYTGLVPTNKSDPWWTSSHVMTLAVSEVSGSPGTKALAVTIDGTPIISNWIFASSIAPADCLTGYRSWGNTATYIRMDITY